MTGTGVPGLFFSDSNNARHGVRVSHIVRLPSGFAELASSWPTPAGGARPDTVVSTAKGTVHGVRPAARIQRDRAFQGGEAVRDTLKYRCPPAADGLECQGQTPSHTAGQVNPENAADGRGDRNYVIIKN